MVLPLIGSFLASSFAPAIAGATGLSFLANPLVAGSIGSGIGSLLQGDSFDEALANGMMSFMGGKLLGGLSNSVSPVATNPSSAVSAGRVIPDGMQALGSEGLAAKTLVPSNPAQFGSEGFFGNALKQGAATAMANPLMAAGVAGGSMLQDAMSPQEAQEKKKAIRPNRNAALPPKLAVPNYGISAWGKP